MNHPVEVNTNNSNQVTRVQFIWIVVLILWCALLLFGVLVSSVTNLMHLKSVSFHLVPRPYWSGFFSMDFYGNLGERGWYIAKFGHLVGFGVLEILLTLAFRRRTLSPIIALLFAIGTELIQIPFGRDGRLYDVLIDTSGIMISTFIQKLWLANKTRSS